MSQRIKKPKEAKLSKGPKGSNPEKKAAMPPPIRLQGGNGLVLYPKMKQQADGSWTISEPEEIKGLLRQSRISGLK